MPEVVIYLLEGRSVDQKRGVVKDVTEALVKNLQVPADVVVVTLVETKAINKGTGGILFSDRT